MADASTLTVHSNGHNLKRRLLVIEGNKDYIDTFNLQMERYAPDWEVVGCLRASEVGHFLRTETFDAALVGVYTAWKTDDPRTQEADLGEVITQLRAKDIAVGIITSLVTKDLEDSAYKLDVPLFDKFTLVEEIERAEVMGENWLKPPSKER